MKTLFKWFIEHPKLINLLLILVIIMGSLSFMNLKRNSIPKVDFKMMFVTTIYPGAAPEDVEINVTIPIEEEIQKVANLKQMASYSAENFSTIFVEIDPDIKNIEEVKRDIYKAVDRVANLPKEVRDKPLVTELKSEIFPVFEVAISGNTHITELDLRKYARTLEKKLLLVPGVGGTTKVGYRKREIRIEVDPFKAANNYVSLAEVMGAVAATNIRVSGGTVQSLSNKKKVITLAQFEELMDVKEVIVRSVFSGKRILVSDIAQTTDSFEEETKLVKANGIPCINIVVEKKANADSVTVAEKVRELLEDYNKELPSGIKAEIVKDYSIYVKSMLQTVISNAIVGFFLVILCLMIFLDRRVAFWTAIGIPFSILVAFYFMPFYDIAVTNQSLLAFIIVLGMLVDDAIVVAEHIFSYREKGLDPIEASVKGISEIFWPVCATVTTTIAAFLPILLMGGIWGEFIRAIPIVITITLLASLFEAAFILPSHVAHTTLRKKAKPRILVFLESVYRRNLLRVLKRKFAVIGTFIVIFIISVGVILPILGFQLFPTSDADLLMVKLETPKGTPLKETEKRVSQIETIILETIPDDVLVSYVTTIGEKGTDIWDSISGISQDHWARVTINLSPAQERKLTSFQIKEQLEERFKVCKESEKFVDIGVITQAGGPPTGRPIDISFIGNNDQARTELGNELYSFLNRNDAVSDIFRNDEKGLTELNIELDKSLMSELGITAADVAGVVRAAISGNVVTSIRKDGEDVDFRVMLAEKYRNDPYFIRDLTLPNRLGKLIKLGSFISFTERSSPLAITHEDGDRVLQITADLDKKKENPGKFARQLRDKFEPMVARYPDTRMVIGGEEQYAQESLTNFFNAMVLALIVIYLILVVLFNSFTEPIIVMLAIPFGLIGVILAFLIHRETMSFLGLIGILGLGGVVVNNSLVMLKFLNKKEEEICNNGERLDLGHIADAATARFRPIILTTITTVAGLLPSLYGLFGGRIDFIFPLLLALSWGLVFSSFITLFLIPTFYIIERNINVWVSMKFGWFKSKDSCRIDLHKY